MGLPATLAEAEIAAARRCADALIEQLLTEDLLDIGIPLLNPNAGYFDARQKYKCLFRDDVFSRQTVLNAALNGFAPARIALGELVQEIAESEWPSELKTFAKACSNPHFKWPLKPGAKRLSHVYSDIAFVMVVLELSRRFPNVRPISQSGRRVCLCDIAADTFTKHQDRTGRGKITRTQGMKIWQRRRKIPRIGDPYIRNIFNKLS